MPRYKRASDIKVGVIGYSGAFNMGKVHLTDMKAAGMCPVAVCELDKTRLEAAQADFPGIETYLSVDEMLRKSEVNLVVIITPHNLHAAQAMKCLRANRNVILEKPMAVTTAECDRLIAEAKKRNLLVSAYHNRHWDGWIMTARRKIEEGAIGDIVRIEAHAGGYSQPADWWRSSKSISGGILYDWGVHLLEYSLQLLKGDILEVSGYSKTGFWAGRTKWKKDTNEDEGFAVVRFSDGKWLTLSVSNIDSNPKSAERGMLEITGTTGSYNIMWDTYQIKRHRNGIEEVLRGKSEPSRWDKYYENIAAHLTKGEKLVITAEWSRRPIHILDLACRSAMMSRSFKARYR